MHPDVIRRYRSMIPDHYVPTCEPEPGTGLSHLLWMLGEISNHTDPEKSARWLGFIQGVLIMRGFTTVQAERDFTRPYFTK